MAVPFDPLVPGGQLVHPEVIPDKKIGNHLQIFPAKGQEIFIGPCSPCLPFPGILKKGIIPVINFHDRRKQDHLMDGGLLDTGKIGLKGLVTGQVLNPAMGMAVNHICLL